MGLAAAVSWHRSDTEVAENQPQDGTPAIVAAPYLGSDACASCHRRETEEWRASQHHDAMAEANEKTILGDFGGSAFTYAGTTSTFSKRRSPAERRSS